MPDQITGFADHVIAEVLSPGGAMDSQATYQYLTNMGISYLGITAQEAIAYLSQAAG